MKPHLVHETVRAELNARRAGTRGAKSRGLVAGGRAKPWRQKGTGRARAGTIRAPQFTGGGVAFPPVMRGFEVKVNRKARRAAFRGALSNHAANGTLALVGGSTFETPSTKQARKLLEAWGKDGPLVVVATEDEETLIKSFRNLRACSSDRAVGARGRLGRLGARAPDQRGGAADRPGEGRVDVCIRTRCCSRRSSRRRATA